MASRGCTGAGGDRRRRRHVDTVAVSVAYPSAPLERICNLPMVPGMYGPQGWADLPDALLESIASLLVVSFPYLLAFAATCRSWRAAFAQFSSLLPPLLLQTDVPLCSPRPRPYSSSLVPRRPCYVTNLATQNMYMCCQIPLFCHFGKRNGLSSPLDKFAFIGASYGHLILSNKQSCLVVNVFTGVSVSPPQLLVHEDTQLYYGALTAPLASPNSHLMVTAWSHSFFWRVGSHSWVRRSNHDKLINRVVVFKGQVFGTNNNGELFIVHLVPQIRLQNILDGQGKSMMFSRAHCFRWLVACGDMLLMVSYQPYPSTWDTFEAFRLDLSAEAGKWVKVEELENCAIFISTDDRSQALCCMNPERWGGRSNCIYCYDSKEWTFCRGSMMQPMWVVPSMFYLCPR